MSARFLPLAASLLICAGALRAEISLATPFCDGAILQRGKPVPVWGAALPGEKVTVQFHGQRQHAVADRQGRWKVMLDALEASAEPAQVVVAGKNMVTIKDVLVGEVWLCSGQSNMHFFLRQVTDARGEIAAANYPLIRQFTVRAPVSDAPLEMAEGEWTACSPGTAADFIAVGYFFARDLFRELGVPIGIVKATLGGSPIEAWMNAEALASDPAFAVVAERWELMRRRVKPGDRNQPSGLYNALMHPIEPFGLAGFVWYQGEGNAPRASEYARLFAAMIQQRRRDFQQGDLPFLFVQLPNFKPPREPEAKTWAWQREAQASALALPRTGMAVTIDVGDPAVLHPPNKKPVGKRLALIALAQVYGRAIEHSGPVFSKVESEGAALRVRFEHAAGLRFVGDPAHAFEIAGEDRRFVPAPARIDGASVVVSAPGVPQPAAVRFEWLDAPDAYLTNDAGLPAAPFRTDRW